MVKTRMSGRVNVHHTAVATNPISNAREPVDSHHRNRARVSTPRLIDSDSDRIAKSQLLTWVVNAMTRTPPLPRMRATGWRTRFHTTMASATQAIVPSAHCPYARAASLGNST
jgi:hypothetical protein